MGQTVRLNDAFKGYQYDQDKMRPPVETAEWVMGRFETLDHPVLAQVMRIDSGRLDIPVFVSMCAPEATAYTGTQKQMGKGATPDQARASALMELAERFSFFGFMKGDGFEIGPAEAVDGPLMDLSELCGAVGHPSDDVDRAVGHLRWTPFYWTWATNLTTGEGVKLPIDWFYAINEFNGPSAGNSLEEAILQGLCEIVERHVSAVVWHDNLSCPVIDESTIEDEVLLELLGKFRVQGVEVRLYDYSLNTGIATVAALAWDPVTHAEKKSEIVFTSGTATTPAKAAIRALTEVAQLAGDFNIWTDYKISALPKFKTLDEAAFVLKNEGEVSLSDLPDISDDNIKVEIERGVTALDKIGLRVYVVETTHPVLEVPAVYIIVPGAMFSDRTYDTNAVVHLARLLVRSDSPALAQRTIENLRADYPGTVYLPFFEAVSLISMGAFEPALQRLDLAEGRGPADDELAAVNVQRAVCLREMGDFEAALACLAKAKDLDASQIDIFQQEGFCLFKLERYKEAIESFYEAIRLDHGSAIDYANIGTNLRRLGRNVEAIAMYKNALELDPSLEYARQNLAEIE